MSHEIAAIAARVRSQAQALPALYGQIDFDTPPERFADGPDDRTELSEVKGNAAPIFLQTPKWWRASVNIACWATSPAMPMLR